MRSLGVPLLAAALAAGAPDKLAVQRRQADSYLNGRSLQKAYGNLFDMGASVLNPKGQLTGDLEKLANTQFKAFVPDFFMTWEQIQPEEDEWSWSRPDRFVDWGEKNNKTVWGHCLVWKEKEWMVDTEDKDVLLARIEKNIKTVVGRYKGRIQKWNVVNEAFNDNGTIRDDAVIPKVLRGEYIEKAFRWAKEADPNALLYFNEYHMYLPEKADAVIAFVKEMKAKGVPIDGISIQGHQYHVDNSDGGTARSPTVEDFIQAIEKSHAAGLRVVISELDVSVLPNKWKCCKGTELSDYDEETQKEYNPFPNGMDQDTEEKLNDRYKRFFKMLIDNQDKIEEVHFWGLTDKYSWYNNYPIRGRTDYPLLFDRAGKPKRAYDTVMALMGA
eukprot:comp9120_c0_seq1/m.4287 comp9120_c0_seq1/g.4287  ORF comp9120_c0_seq1/g.4287 comp9120_c0_seq1/m.4287 type:complete len:386 (-) comp9120_c0_seq1:563-1720(-)